MPKSFAISNFDDYTLKKTTTVSSPIILIFDDQPALLCILISTMALRKERYIQH